MRYKTKPFVIEAIQWTEQNKSEVLEFIGKTSYSYTVDGIDAVFQIWDYLQETYVKVNRDDYIIKGMKGEFYPCDPEVFKAKYEKIVPFDFPSKYPIGARNLMCK